MQTLTLAQGFACPKAGHSRALDKAIKFSDLELSWFNNKKLTLGTFSIQ